MVIISPEKKDRVLAELRVPGSDLSKIARIHKVSRSTIYKWLENLETPAEEGKFALLEIKDSPKNQSYLQHACLRFGDVSLTMEGKIKSSTLSSIIQILESESC